MYAPYTMTHQVMDPQYVIMGKYYYYHGKRETPFEHKQVISKYVLHFMWHTYQFSLIFLIVSLANGSGWYVAYEEVFVFLGLYFS